MNEDTSIRSLQDLSELRQTLAARPPKLLRGIVLVVVALLGAGVAWATLTYSDLTVRATGRIRPIDSEGGETKVNALIGGQVVEVTAHVGDTVKTGDLLIRIDSQKLDNDLTEQRRLIEEARIELTKLKTLRDLKDAESVSAIEKADADIRQEEDRISREEEQQQVELRRARTELKKAKEEELRIRTLVEQEAAPKTELEKAESAVREAEYRLEKAGLAIGKAYLDTLRKARELLTKKYAVVRNETDIRILQKEGQIESAEKRLKNLELEKSHTEVRSPIAGTVTQSESKKGDIVQRGKALLIISQQKGMQMEAYVETRDVGLLKIGMKTKIRLDAFDYQKYGTLGGTITSISPDSKMEEGKVFYVIRIDLDKDEVGLGAQRGKVKLGMLGMAEAVTGKETILSIVFRKFRKKIDIQ